MSTAHEPAEMCHIVSDEHAHMRMSTEHAHQLIQKIHRYTVSTRWPLPVLDSSDI